MRTTAPVGSRFLPKAASTIGECRSPTTRSRPRQSRPLYRCSLARWQGWAGWHIAVEMANSETSAGTDGGARDTQAAVVFEFPLRARNQIAIERPALAAGACEIGERRTFEHWLR